MYQRTRERPLHKNRPLSSFPRACTPDILECSSPSAIRNGKASACRGAGCWDRISFRISHNNVAYPQSVETEPVLKNVPSCSFRALTCLVPPSRCLTPTPTRIMTGATKRWILSPRLQSTSWRSGWRSWSSSLWSWRKVGKTQASHPSAVPLIYVLSVRDSTSEYR